MSINIVPNLTPSKGSTEWVSTDNLDSRDDNSKGMSDSKDIGLMNNKTTK